MIDVLLYQTLDDGDVLYRNNTLAYDETYRTAVYLSLFGGNTNDDGSQNSKNKFWGNYIEPYRSETQFLLKSLPLIPINLRRIEDAVKRDLQWMIDDSICKSIEVESSMPAVNTVKIDVTINDIVLTFTFWRKEYGDANG